MKIHIILIEEVTRALLLQMVSCAGIKTKGDYHLHHVTLEYGIDDDHDIRSFDTRLYVTHIGTAPSGVVAFKALLPSHYEVENPHITAFVPYGAKPVDAKFIDRWEPLPRIMPINGYDTVMSGRTPAIPSFDSEEEAWDWMMLEDLDCVDNYRFARLNSVEELEEYEKRLGNGCCGYRDCLVVVDGQPAKIGCNYGH